MVEAVRPVLRRHLTVRGAASIASSAGQASSKVAKQTRIALAQHLQVARLFLNSRGRLDRFPRSQKFDARDERRHQLGRGLPPRSQIFQLGQCRLPLFF